MNIPNRQACMRILADGSPTQPFTVSTMPPPTGDPSRVQELLAKSYQKYGRPREEIEFEIQQRYNKMPEA
jgi:hypothetical protein